MPRETEPAAGTQGPPAGERPAVGTDGGQPVLDTSVAYSSRVHDYWLGGKNDFAADRAAGAARRYNRLARETQRHRSQAEVARFFDGLELVEPGVVPVQEWRPGREAAASTRSAMWGGVARKP